MLAIVLSRRLIEMEKEKKSPCDSIKNLMNKETSMSKYSVKLNQGQRKLLEDLLKKDPLCQVF